MLQQNGGRSHLNNNVPPRCLPENVLHTKLVQGKNAAAAMPLGWREGEKDSGKVVSGHLQKTREGAGGSQPAHVLPPPAWGRV